jgi:predicted nucleic acid-binding protein
MTTCFFDTSALVPRYHKGRFTYRINRIFTGHKRIFICEITVLEIASAFASNCRDKHLPDEEYERMQSEFFRDIANDRISIRSLDSSDLFRAMHLIALAGVVNRRGLRSSDAIVAVSCRQLAFETGERVTFYTKDWKLYRTLYEIGAYRSAMKLRFLGRGRDGIPASTK